MKITSRTTPLCVAAVIMLLVVSAAGQTRKAPNSEVVHWIYLLDRLSTEAKTLRVEPERDESVIAIAEAFWEIDNKKSRELFRWVLDHALTLEPRLKDQSLRQLIVIAGALDSDFGKQLAVEAGSKQALAERGKSLNGAADLVDINPRAAEAIALANVSLGPSFDSATLIYKLHEKEPDAAARVYSAYLTAYNRLNPSQLLWLAGYPFGVYEAYGGSLDPLRQSGVFGSGRPTPAPNPLLARAFLAVAMQTVDGLLQRSESSNAFVFFVTAYLAPHFEQYRPDVLERWLSLQQTVGNSLEPTQREKILELVNTLHRSREPRKSEESLSQTDELLDDVEKLPTSCARDLVYARAALKATSRTNFNKATSIADKISDLPLRRNVLQAISYDMALFAISPKSSAGLDEALSSAQRVDAPEQRAYLYLMIAEFASQRDRDRSRFILNDLLKACDRIENPAKRAAMLLATAYRLSTIDESIIESFTIMEKAIQLLSDAKGVRLDQISILRRVDLNCDGSGTWWGDSGRLGQLNLIETLLRISDKEPTMAEELALKLPEGANRIRTLAAIAKSQIRKLGARRRQTDKLKLEL